MCFVLVKKKKITENGTKEIKNIREMIGSEQIFIPTLNGKNRSVNMFKLAQLLLSDSGRGCWEEEARACAPHTTEVAIYQTPYIWASFLSGEYPLTVADRKVRNDEGLDAKSCSWNDKPWWQTATCPLWAGFKESRWTIGSFSFYFMIKFHSPYLGDSFPKDK